MISIKYTDKNNLNHITTGLLFGKDGIRQIKQGQSFSKTSSFSYYKIDIPLTYKIKKRLKPLFYYL
jgi:hypothetical protein